MSLPRQYIKTYPLMLPTSFPNSNNERFLLLSLFMLSLKNRDSEEKKNKKNNRGRWCRSVTLNRARGGRDIYGQLSEFPVNLLIQLNNHHYKNFIVLKSIEQYRLT
jgi:hypothetical protein